MTDEYTDLWQEGQLCIVFLNNLFSEQLLLIGIDHVLEELAAVEFARWEVRIVAKPHLRVELVIFDLEINTRRLLAQLCRQRLLSLFPPGVVVTCAAQLEHGWSHGCLVIGFGYCMPFSFLIAGDAKGGFSLYKEHKKRRINCFAGC